MTDLPAKRPSSSSRDVQLSRASIGAVLAAVLWLELIAFGVPNIIVAKPGYSVIPVAAVAGGLLGLTRFLRWLMFPVVAFAIALAIVAYTPIMRRPTRALVRSDSLSRPVQAVVLLSGGVTSDGHVKPPVVDRALTALSLVKRGLATTLIVSRERWGPPGRGVTSDADQQRLVALLERPVRLLIVDSVYSTRDEAVRMRALARTLDIASVAVVTSPLHTYRACATFEKVGFTVTCVPSESRDVALGSLLLVSDRVRAFQRWLYECAALVKYRAQGWI